MSTNKQKKSNPSSDVPEQINKLILEVLDPNSFVPIGSYVKDAQVTTGHGTISGRLVYLYCQEGAVNTAHAKKIANLYGLALKMGAPVIGLLDSKGAYLDDGTNVLDAYGKIFSVQSEASGVIPQISYIKGECLGIASFICGLSDFVFMSEDNSKMFLESPTTYSDIKGTNPDKCADAAFHATQSGLAHFTYENEQQTIAGIRQLVDLLPSNNLEEAPFAFDNEDLNREDAQLNNQVPNDNKQLPDIYGIAGSLADNGLLMEIQKNYAPELKVFMVRFAGFTAGLAANYGDVTVNGLNKLLKFVKFCDAFNIPVVNLVDANMYSNNKANDSKLISLGAQIMDAYASATVPKVSVIIRNAVASPYLMMNSKHIGADMVFGWNNAKVGPVNPDAAEKVLKTQISTVYDVAALGYIDEVIEPAQTRKHIIVALEMLSSKRVSAYTKKHGTV